jgi:pimeloyl-ACP methyl ester carboxylesterase
MNCSYLSHLTRLASIGLFVATGYPTHLSAQTGSPRQVVENVLLVHGAWADGSSWSKVIPRLTEAGFHVVAVQIPLTSLADDVATTERAIALVNGPVLLVGHSYGGAVITGAGNDPKVVGLVFISAFAPDEGESSLSLATANPTPAGATLKPDSFGFFELAPEVIARDFAQDLSDREKDLLTVTQIPIAGAALAAPATHPAWKDKPNWFIVAENDRAVSPQLEEMEALRMNATIIALPTSHVAMLAAPQRVAEFIQMAAETLSHK